MAQFDKPSNRKRGSLWAVTTAVIVVSVLFFMFFSSRDGERPSSTTGGTVSIGASPTTGNR